MSTREDQIDRLAVVFIRTVQPDVRSSDPDEHVLARYGHQARPLVAAFHDLVAELVSEATQPTTTHTEES